MFDNSVFGFLPMFASKGDNSAVLFGIRLSFWILAIFVQSDSLDHMGLQSSTLNPCIPWFYNILPCTLLPLWRRNY